jgi:hypothetical protein
MNDVAHLACPKMAKSKRTHVALKTTFSVNQRVEWWTILVPVLASTVLFLLAIVVVVGDECLGYLFVTFSFTIT